VRSADHLLSSFLGARRTLPPSVLFQTPPPARAPALVGLLPKSRYSETDKARVIAQAVGQARGIRVPIPIFYGGKLAGWSAPAPGCVQGLHNESMYLAPITSYDDMINAITNSGQRLPTFYHKANTTSWPAASAVLDLWPIGTIPTVGTYTGAANTARSLTVADVGALPFEVNGAVTPKIKHIVHTWSSITQGPGMVMLYDRVLTYEDNAFTNNTTQNMTNVVAPTRYVTAGQNGWSLGMQIMFTVQTAISNVAADLTALAYTNQLAAAGTISQTPVPSIVTNIGAPTSTLGARVIAPCTNSTNTSVSWSIVLPLAAGDVGVQTVTSYKTSAQPTGTFCVVLFRPLAWLPTIPGLSGVSAQVDQVIQTHRFERAFDSACLSFLAINNTPGNLPVHVGGVDFVWA
jgi:hypothetical protein